MTEAVIWYLFAAITVLALNVTAIPSMLVLIVKSAFGLDSAVGGGLGVAVMFVVLFRLSCVGEAKKTPGL